ncbi:MAG: dephospho-CoA kinase [Actinomycetota bacterium]|jgi:dephospho-CoA kinase|nr:dephospho-CoA kinase [Actinomycetota bacterium]
MLFVGLTGGIGSGKSTAAAIFADLGAVIVDADAFAREAAASSSPQFPEIIALFGPEMVRADGELDRAAVAAIVFADPAKLRALESVIHPVVEARIQEELARHDGTDTIIVLDTPLLIPMGGYTKCDAVVVVAASPERQLARLIERGMTEPDARARMAAQPPLEELAGHADHVLDNEGSEDELRGQVARLWSELERALRAQGGDPR